MKVELICISKNEDNYIDEWIDYHINHYFVKTKQEESSVEIAQAVLCPVVNGKYVNLIQVDKVEDGDRGDNGFGSKGLI
jgi:dUTPase